METIYMLRVECYSEGDLVETTNHGAFKTFRGASQFAIDEGFTAFYDDDLSERNDEETISFELGNKESGNEDVAYVENYLVHE